MARTVQPSARPAALAQAAGAIVPTWSVPVATPQVVKHAVALVTVSAETATGSASPTIRDELRM